MGNKESEYIDDIPDDEMNVAETSIADSVGHEVGLYLKNCVSKFDNLRGEKLIKQLRGDNDRKADDGQRNKRDEEELARQPYFKSESYLINARMHLRPDKNEDIFQFVDRILRYTNMQRCPYSEAQNVLIINIKRKFTFLNNDTATRNAVCDKNMLKELEGIYNPSIRERMERGLVSTLIGTKARFGMGVRKIKL